MLKLTQLAGFGGGGQRQIQLTHIATESTMDGSGNISHPASGIEAGDLLVYFATAYEAANTDPPSMANPSGYSEILLADGAPGGSSAIRVIAGYKIATGSEDGSSVNVSSSAGTDAENAIIMQFRPNLPIATVTVVDTDTSITANDPGSQVQGGASIQVSLHAALYFGSATAPSSRSYSPTQDADVDLTGQGSGDCFVRWKLFNPPTTAEAVTVDMGDHGNNCLASFSLLVTVT